MIEKPQNSQWTDDQWKAIVAGGRDILVAAAAGSGKTAVLVERMIKKIINPEQPVDVDRLLVVTFTNASAQEMKNRIGEALEKELAEQPASPHLRKQLSLLNKAAISTIHSFCLQVIRTYYYMLDIDPGFRIANETEIDLLKEEVLEDILEEEYGLEGNTAFFDLVDRYTSDRHDDDLQEMLLKLHTESRAHPNPDRWLDQLVALYDVEGKSLDDLPYTRFLLESASLQLEAAKQYLQRGLQVAEQPDGPAPLADTFTGDLAQLDVLLQAIHTSWEAAREAVNSLKWDKAKTVRKGTCDEKLSEEAKKLRDKAKKEIAKLQEELFQRSAESYLQDLRTMQPVLAKLVSLVKEFSVRFQQLKRNKSMVDFTDLEHFCLAVLGEEQDGQLQPSPVALQYRDRFAEVLIDEYQDVNFVQESILRLVTKGAEESGNLFMVGDVKQSIYKFRLAEPGLFLGKYKRFQPDGLNGGMRIDLAKNFRSRQEVLAGTNFIFKQIMGERVGDIDYDYDAELKLGAAYPEGPSAAELLLVNRSSDEPAVAEEGEEAVQEDMDLETVQLEARLIGRRIKEMVESGYEVYDRKQNNMRPVSYRDFVILLRSMPWAPQIMEELKLMGIPVYADLSTGYFEATEVTVMLNVLRTIDNPAQDIPLASVLRSPIVGLTDEELAVLRTRAKKGSFYQVASGFLQQPDGERELQEKLSWFFRHLQEWRQFATEQPLSDLIWRIYRQTGYYDFVGGLPGGKQRQANLRVLYDRARQYEATSFRGLFRFLRFIERILERGDDMGTARALGEQEDVVRLMTIHKSKGLEFPVVFVAGLGRQFNTRDLSKPFLLHKDLGFGSQYIDPQKRIKYTMLPQLAIKRKMRMEMIAEEMRVLYVALTRAKEKLILVGSVKQAADALKKWGAERGHGDWLLPDYVRAQAACYLDWIGPALLRHGSSAELADCTDAPAHIRDYDVSWRMEVVEAAGLQGAEQLQEEKQELLAALKELRPVAAATEWKEAVEERLHWQYRYQASASHRAKQSVTEIKRNTFIDESDSTIVKPFQAPIEKRPRFMERKGLTSAERGTAMHALMQHIDISRPVDETAVREQIAEMVNKELLTFDQSQSVEPKDVVAFFETELGQRILQAPVVRREVPFTMMLPASRAYQKDWRQEQEDLVLVQGVVDCMLEEEDGIVLIDFKTDRVTDRFPGGFEEARPVLAKRYEVQLDLYSQALYQSLQKKVKAKYLYFFDGSHILPLQGEISE
ncbi:helicase-exonuclease AddAB subunit AddA [Ectobacillus ponti]|uniref:ATP-dependent helicase/nuclease subunit A n=1 Tax=Ectobacillus ponti TaxID=2961894 RepID=A0AA41X7F2_9BACI|nr:helicase-exonuclease AddAB subunit AddA [Ectobacillus ponti]MCP8968240.1 helicase-exonuclease AddAB subunit AddA [Ectobacillus ponti]